jgi:hypothetical protein
MDMKGYDILSFLIKNRRYAFESTNRVEKRPLNARKRSLSRKLIPVPVKQ